MSPRRRADSNSDDLVDAPFLDEAERAESAWLIVRDQDPDALPPSPEVARQIAETEDLLASLPPHVDHVSWQEEVLKAALASTPRAPTPWWRRRAVVRAIGGGLLTACAAVILMIYPRHPPELEVVIARGDQTHDPRRTDAKAVVGDRLVITARPNGPSDLRVYRTDGKLVARCPGGPSCSVIDDSAYTMEVVLDAPVKHRVILVLGKSDPASGTVDAYLEAARASSARIISYPLIDVE